VPLSVVCSNVAQVATLITQDVLMPSDTVFPNFDTSNGPVECTVIIGESLVVVDKVVEDGPSDPPDFTHTVMQGGTALGSGVDPAPNTFCSEADSFANCAVINVAADSGEGAEAVALVEEPPPGYDVASVECTETHRIDNLDLDGTGMPADAPPADSDDINLDGDGPSDAYCIVTNQWIGGTLDVDVSVVNDDGGTGMPADVTIEIYDSTDALISSHPCPADGNCVINGMLPPGDYTLGYTGLPTYTDSWTQTTTPPMIPTAIDTQAIITDDPDAAFTIVTGGLVSIDGVFDDPPPATTTTTTTTTTTIVPATTTTTSLVIPIAPTLPETGASAAANARIAMVAVGLIAAGGALVIAVSRRRTA
jgi:hypothetical protein